MEHVKGLHQHLTRPDTPYRYAPTLGTENSSHVDSAVGRSISKTLITRNDKNRNFPSSDYMATIHPDYPSLDHQRLDSGDSSESDSTGDPIVSYQSSVPTRVNTPDINVPNSDFLSRRSNATCPSTVQQESGSRQNFTNPISNTLKRRTRTI